VCVCVCVGIYVYVSGCVIVCSHDQNDLKLGTVAVFDIMLQSTDCGFKRSRVRARVRVRELVSICISRECAYLPVYNN